MSLDLPIALLLAKSMTASGPKRLYRIGLSAGCYDTSVRSVSNAGAYTDWNVHSESGAAGIVAKLEKVLADDSSFEEGESRPTVKAISEIASLLRGAERAKAAISSAEVSCFYGDIAVTWKLGYRYLRLVAYSDTRQPLLYFEDDNPQRPSRGRATRPATVDAIKSKLEWLLSDSTEELTANATHRY